MKFSFISTVAVVALTLTGCGGSSSDDNPATVTDRDEATPINQALTPAEINATAKAALNGTWTSGCFQIDGTYTVINITFADGYVLERGYLYTDSNCANPRSPSELEISMDIEYPTGITSTPLGDASFINATATEVRVDGQPASAELIALFEEQNLFDTRHDIYLITSDGTLYFGEEDEEEFNQLSPEQRSGNLDTSYTLTRM